MTSRHVRPSVFRESRKLAVLSLRVGSVSARVAVGMETFDASSGISLLELEENQLNILLEVSKGDRRQCVALWTMSNTASMNISVPK